ncbi:MAG: xanthine dehydrogenase family protein molybdopterin-binding subunit [Verrucomicrobia bacterium]|nr:xanthine dehydrogenase family protein molybdopterin-binding subunit [Verrucomicrobiota bacterium]
MNSPDNPGSHEPGRKLAAVAAVCDRRFSRRDFLKTFGGGLAILYFIDDLAAQESGGGGRRGGGQARPRSLAAWLHVAADGAITVFTGKMECGQNARTSLTQVVAEELPAPLAAIKLVMGDTALTPYDAGTFGSQTTPNMVPQLRRVAATAREALLELAAKEWSVDRTTLTAAGGQIHHAASGRAIGYGELTKGEKLLVDISDATPLKPAASWKVAGTSVAKINGRDFVTGAHRYASDVTRPGLLHGRVLRPAAFDATLASLDVSAAESMPGVKIIRDGNFAGVVAPTEHQAAQAIAALHAEWKTSPQISDRELFAHLRATARTQPPAPSPDAFRQTYTVAYIAHAPLEPRAAVAEWTDGALTVWTGTQRPFGVRSELMQAFALPEGKVRVIVPDTGSGYGGKHTGEYAVEAARLARGAGRPVKLVWTREEEFTWAYARPAGVIDLASVAGADGRITHWAHDNYNSGPAAIRAPYDFPGQRADFHPARSPLRQGSYRGLAATANHFARETHLDEVARSLRLDPLELRLRNLREPRARAVLEAAAEKFGWQNFPRAPDRGIGLAYGFDKGGHVATCAEVAVDRTTGRVRVVRVTQAFECGAIINPDHLRNQNEGCIVQGLGGALFEALRFDHGRLLNPRFSAYRVPRFSDTPKIDLVLLDRQDLPSAGAGECPIVGIAPAVGSAIFDATGVRLRSLPLVPNGLKV